MNQVLARALRELARAIHVAITWGYFFNVLR